MVSRGDRVFLPGVIDRFPLKPGAFALMATFFNHRAPAARGNCAITLDGRDEGRFESSAAVREGWATRTYPVLLAATDGDRHELSFTTTAKARLPIRYVDLRRLR